MSFRLTSDNTYEWLENEVSVTVPMEKTIEDYKSELASTDYKVIKCIEYSLIDNQLPYDIVSLHQERQAIRDIINEMEEDYGTDQ